jgi:hypothetical protein
VSLHEMLRNGASCTDLFGWGEHSVEDVIALFELVIVLAIVLRIRSEVREVIIVGQVVPIVSGPLFRVNGADGWGRTFTQLPEDRGSELLVLPDSS